MGTKRNGADRRTFLKAVGAGAATSIVASGAAGARRADSLDDQLTAVRDATAKYRDPRVALDDGFQIMGPFVPGMGWHFIHPERVRSVVANDFTLTEPQLLTYGDAGNGLAGLVLGSIEYAIPVDARGYTEENPPDLFADEDGSEQWHTHGGAEHAFIVPVDPEKHHMEESSKTTADASPEDLLRSTNWIELVPGGSPGQPMLRSGTMVVGDLAGGEPIDARMVAHSSVHPDLLTLHAWVHHENPDGVFVGINPALPGEPTP